MALRHAAQLAALGARPLAPQAAASLWHSRVFSSAAGPPAGDGDATRPPPPPDSSLAAWLSSLAAGGATGATPRRGILAETHGIGEFVRDLVRGLRARAAVALTRTHLETEFDEAEFLGGAKDAYFMVLGAVGDGDWRALRPAVSPSLLAGFKGVRAAYTAAGLTPALAVDAATLVAAIDDMALLNDAALQAVTGGGGGDASAAAAPAAESADSGDGAPPRPASPLPSPLPSLAGMHQVLAVRFTGAVTVAVRDAAGALVSELVDRRPKTWRFARGPLPGGLPVRRLDAPWTLLAID